MSRVGKKPIELPAGVDAKIAPGMVTVKGPLGEISQVVNPKLEIKKDSNKLVVARQSDQKVYRELSRPDAEPDRQHGHGRQQGI